MLTLSNFFQDEQIRIAGDQVRAIRVQGRRENAVVLRIPAHADLRDHARHFSLPFHKESHQPRVLG